MRISFYKWLGLVLIVGLTGFGRCFAEVPSIINKLNIYSGYYSREGNDDKMAQTSGNNQYVKFYPENRIVRLYIPYPYSKSVRSDAINHAFNSAVKMSTHSAYIKNKFDVMAEPIVAHLDKFHVIDGQVMYDCDKPTPCRVTFDDSTMTVVKPGLVLEHKIHYELVKDH